MKTVQRDPRSIGCLDFKANSANSSMVYPNDLANVSRNDPQPAEHASFNEMFWIISSLIVIAFIS